MSCCQCAAPGAWTFNSSIAGSNFTYTLNTTMVSMVDAEHQCACQGGHLVSYVSPEEQQVRGTHFHSAAGPGQHTPRCTRR
jgi:hypothetical protein